VDNKIIKHALLISIIVVSGCVDPIEDILEADEAQDDWDTPDSEKGVNIEALELSDSVLQAYEDEGQRAEVTLRLANYHTERIELEEVEMYNTGLLELEEREAECNTRTMERAGNDEAPQAECNWVIYAPSTDTLDSVGERTESVTVSFSYDASFTNQQPIPIQFQNPDEMSNVEQIHESFTNSEIQTVIETSSPISTERDGSVEVTLREGSAPGRVISDYELSYEPEDMLEGCPIEGEPQIDSEYEFNCEIVGDNPIQESFTITADYKYEQSETLSIPIRN